MMSHWPFKVIVLTFFVGLLSLNGPAILQSSSTRSCLLWIIVQHLPPTSSFIWRFLLLSNKNHTTNDSLWTEWEERQKMEATMTGSNDGGGGSSSKIQAIPSVDLRDSTITADNVLARVEQQWGTDWRRRPLLLQGLWSSEPEESLLLSEQPNNHHHHKRRLSLAGLLDEDMVIPYYYDATQGGVSPDATARIGEIVANMTTTTQKYGQQPPHHKIATQLLIQKYPSLMREVVPNNGILTALFGNYFQPEHVIGSGPFGLFPALTTVPLFVAAASGAAIAVDNSTNDPPSTAYTPLHSEPICNVAVQLVGSKDWTLIDAQHWQLVRPALAADGRAFVTSQATTSLIPAAVPYYYQGTTNSGDALWLPAWTWHRVDYNHHQKATTTAIAAPNTTRTASTTTISIGASIFHFRLDLFVQQNPVLTLAVIPALIRELLGWGVQ
jgi:hypothetical protein